MAKKEKIFATADKPLDEETRARKRSLIQERCERLCANEDFKEWLYGVLDDLCAFEFGRNPLDEFTQGIRATADVIQHSLIYGNNGVEFVTDLKRRYLNSLREGVLRNNT